MDDNSKIMELAYEAGAILLENGAEISRVDETMRRIAGHYGVDDESFFVLSNGIMATAKGFARTKFIPIKGASLDKVVAVNQLSREVSEGKCDLEQLESRLKAIRAMRPKPAWEQIAASAFGSAAFCISMGVALAFMLDAAVSGTMQHLETLTVAPETAGMFVQLLAAYVGTVAFAVLFGVPRKYYLDSGLCGMLGWLLYLILMNYTELSVANVVFFATVLVTFTAMVLAIVRKCPITVYLICGIFPLVPGAGIFWTTYNVVSEQLGAALHTGVTALKVTVAIAFGIILVAELNGKNRIGKWLAKRRK